MMDQNNNDLFEVQYEDDFLRRTVPGGILTQPDTALTELIANAHDAGATIVNITIPEAVDLPLSVEDNGVGMTDENFRKRWMKLSYNRLVRQGQNVEFPKELSHLKRKAYGRNGVGRHGLLCFNDEYTVETWRDGTCNIFELTSIDPKQPLTVINHQSRKKKKHGTKLIVRASRNLRAAEDIVSLLSRRFFSMPDFSVRINGKEVSLSDHPGIVEEKELQLPSGKYRVTLVDTKLSKKESYFQGVGIWVGGRRVGEQHWRLGKHIFADARRSFSKQFAVIVETDELRAEILEDWSGFKPRSNVIDELAEALSEYIAEKRKQLLGSIVERLKQEALDSIKSDLEELPEIVHQDLSGFISEMLDENPDLDKTTLELALKAAINLEKSHLGQNLLYKLISIDTDDIEALDEMLDEWSVRDALKALSQIDSRIKVIEALSRLSGDLEADELHTIHPLILKARWLFGPEYESTEYSSNLGLTKTIEKVFSERLAPSSFINSKKRPDIVILKDASLGHYAIEDFDKDNFPYVKTVLLIEVKKGKHEVKREDMFQAAGYVEDIIHSGILHSKPYVNAFVVGESLNYKSSGSQSIRDQEENELGKITFKSFSMLISAAERRLFRLRQVLDDRYSEMRTDQLKEDSLKLNNILFK